MLRFRRWVYGWFLHLMCCKGHKTSDEFPDICERCGPLDARGVPTAEWWIK